MKRLLNPSKLICKSRALRFRKSNSKKLHGSIAIFKKTSTQFPKLPNTSFSYKPTLGFCLTPFSKPAKINIMASLGKIGRLLFKTTISRTSTQAKRGSVFTHSYSTYVLSSSRTSSSTPPRGASSSKGTSPFSSAPTAQMSGQAALYSIFLSRLALRPISITKRGKNGDFLFLAGRRCDRITFHGGEKG